MRHIFVTLLVAVSAFSFPAHAGGLNIDIDIILGKVPSHDHVIDKHQKPNHSNNRATLKKIEASYVREYNNLQELEKDAKYTEKALFAMHQKKRQMERNGLSKRERDTIVRLNDDIYDKEQELSRINRKIASTNRSLDSYQKRYDNLGGRKDLASLVHFNHKSEHNNDRYANKGFDKRFNEGRFDHPYYGDNVNGGNVNGGNINRPRYHGY